MADEKIWNVSEVNAAVRAIIENSLLPFWLGGEVGNLTIHRSGHVYLTLKDAKTQIKAVFFGGADQARRLKLAEGTAVEAHGRLSVYEVRGEYQFSISQLRPVGLGDLQKRFEELKKRLAEEGLFEQSRKKPIPALPRRIGVISSPEGAAIRDFLQIITRRFPKINIRIYPAPVQGKGAEKLLAKGLAFFNRHKNVDVIVLTRGGGSLEDLWPFNEEILARAVAASEIPVISAVGHEIDFTICDFVADLRVPTPSAAAELVIGRQDELFEQLANTRRRLQGALALPVERLRRRYENLVRSHVFREPLRLVNERQQELDELTKRLESSLQLKGERCGNRLAMLQAKLLALSPFNVLERGYAILVERESGKTVTSPKLPAGTPLYAQLAGGRLNLRSEE